MIALYWCLLWQPLILFMCLFGCKAYIRSNQIMGWGEKAIEIRSVETGHLDGVFMHKRAQRLKFLCERNDKVEYLFEPSLRLFQPVSSYCWKAGNIEHCCHPPKMYSTQSSSNAVQEKGLGCMHGLPHAIYWQKSRKKFVGLQDNGTYLFTSVPSKLS